MNNLQPEFWKFNFLLVNEMWLSRFSEYIITSFLQITRQAIFYTKIIFEIKFSEVNCFNNVLILDI